MDDDLTPLADCGAARRFRGLGLSFVGRPRARRSLTARRPTGIVWNNMDAFGHSTESPLLAADQALRLPAAY